MGLQPREGKIGAIGGMKGRAGSGDLSKLEADAVTGKFRKEWDFTAVPDEELAACFLYEYGRESETVRALVKGLEGGQASPLGRDYGYLELIDVNPVLAVLVLNASIRAPKWRLATAPWLSLGKSRKWLARICRDRSCFSRATRDEVSDWNDDQELETRSGSPRKCMESFGLEIVFARIDWTKPLPTIRKALLAWAEEEKHRCSSIKAKGGRHANKHAEHKDALRRLGALRLWARHQLKGAMRISREAGVKLCSTYLDEEGRPSNQTAWENAVKGVAKRFQEMFQLDKDEMPSSWQALEKQRMKNRKSR